MNEELNTFDKQKYINKLDSEDITENIQLINKTKSEEETDKINSILEKHFVFYNLTEEELYQSLIN
jgi:hypothetical protein